MQVCGGEVQHSVYSVSYNEVSLAFKTGQFTLEHLFKNGKW